MMWWRGSSRLIWRDRWASRSSSTIGRPQAIVGTDATAKAVPDGHTLLMVASSFTVVPATHPKLPYDPERDLAPIGMVAKNPLLFLVNPKVPAHSLAEFVELARANPGKLNYASPGAATQ